MASIFTRIIAGEIPCHKVAENEHCFAFLDIFPLVKGHTLVVPKKEIDYYFDLDDQLISEINLFSKHVASAIKKAIPCQRVGLSIIGLEVPHAHIHLIPINRMVDMSFERPKLELSQDELAAVAERIRAFI